MSLRVKVFIPPLGRSRRLGCVLEHRSLPAPQPTCNLIIPSREGEEKAALGWLNSFQNGTWLFSGRGRGADHRRGGVPGFIRERRLHCVLLLEQVPETSVQFFRQGWAELPCHKIIAERIVWNLGWYQRELCVTAVSRQRAGLQPQVKPCCELHNILMNMPFVSVSAPPPSSPSLFLSFV